MAKGKKTSSLVCGTHAVTYLLPFLFCGLAWWQLALIGIQHFIQDRTTIVNWLMDVTGKTEFTKPPMAPWSIIVTDNVLHILFIAMVGCA